MKFINHTEGYIEPDGGGGYAYVYQYKDHLSNVRLSYSDANGNGAVDNSEIVEESNYYPFGLKHRGYNDVVNGMPNKFLTYNGVEFEESLGLDLYEMFARGYDPAIGRFIQIDPLGELIQQIDKTPYAFAWNNPVLFNDPDGLCPDCPDPATAAQGDTYTIANGSVYVFNDGEWERQTVEELDEVVVVPPSVNSEEEEDSSATSEANAGVVGATIATGVILSEVTTGTIILPTVGTMASGAIGAGGAGIGLMPLLFLAHLAENPPPRPFYESLASDPYFPITTQPSPGSSHYAQQTSNITAFPNLTPPAYQPLSVEDQLELSAYINQMAKSKKGRKSKKQEDVQHGNQGNGKLSGAKKKKHQKRRPGDMGDKKRQKPGWKQH